MTEKTGMAVVCGLVGDQEERRNFQNEDAYQKKRYPFKCNDFAHLTPLFRLY
jgi:hypothetical protein